MITKELLRKIIENRSFSQLIGETENDFIDCKSGIYDLSNPNKKLELAKDVSSFANADGGFLILGAQTERSATQALDVISKLTPFSESLVNVEQYYGVINDWIYPKIDDLRIQWISETLGADRGFGVISIPSQAAARKPFLITRTSNAGGKFSEILFGLAERKRDTSLPLTIAELHQLIRDGFSFQNSIQQRFDAIDAKLATMASTAVPQPSIEESEITSRVRQTVASANLQAESFLAIAAWPEPRAELSTIFKTTPGSLGSLMDRPPKIREGGFTVRVGVPSRSIEGQLRRASTEGEALDLYRDGTLLFATGKESLCWAMRQSVFNTLALIETVHSFFLLYEAVIRDMVIAPKRISIVVFLGNAENGPLKLVPDEILPGGIYNTPALAPPAKPFRHQFALDTADFSPGRAAYRLLNELFVWYGAESDSIPYTEQVDGIWMVSGEALVAAGKRR